jgi:phosphoribosylformylglycinamidine cyclo-ligase
VDIEAGDRAVDLIKKIARTTFTPGVITEIGGFGGLYSIKDLGMEEPVLVSGTDGVGTKLKIAFALDKHDTVGIDAVAMCVNDVLCCGAQPLFFLDYLATGRLEPEKAAAVVSGIAEGCKQAGCALIGGEIAEMPGFYPEGEYDIAGFCVGAVDRKRIIDGSRIHPGDVILALPSSGLHSNGFSLVRKVIELADLDMNTEFPEIGGKLGAVLLSPTRIYSKEIVRLIAGYDVRGIANITGGGLEGNTIRIIPETLGISIDWGAWQRPAVFTMLQNIGGIAEAEIRKVLNLGIGMTIIMPPRDAEKALKDQQPGLLKIGVVVER